MDSSSSPYTRHENFDAITAEILLDGLHESLQSIESDLSTLETSPDSTDCVNSIFRTLHTIKGNCFISYMDILGKYVHAIEDSLSGLRSNSMLFTPMLKEALLFSFDHLIRCVESVCEYNTLDNEEIEEVIAQFKKYPELAIDRHDLVSAAIIRLLGGEVAEVVPMPAPCLTPTLLKHLTKP